MLGIFFASGLLLQPSALESRAALAYGLVAILAAAPLLAFAVLRLPLQPPEMALGLAVFCCMPTTLSACVAITAVSGGSTAVARLLAVVTNMLGVSALQAAISELATVSSIAGPQQLWGLAPLRDPLSTQLYICT